MSVITTPKFALPLVDGTQANQDVPHNTAIVSLDQLVNLAVANVATPTNTPPGSPADGDAYLIGGSPSGVWTGLSGKVAYYYSGWKYITPKEGMRMYDKNNDKLYTYDGAAWNQVSSGGGGGTGNVTFTDGEFNTSSAPVFFYSNGTFFTSGQSNQALVEVLIGGGNVGLAASTFGIRRVVFHIHYSGTTCTFNTVENVATATAPPALTIAQTGSGFQLAVAQMGSSGTNTRYTWSMRIIKGTNGSV
jgi:hypothetical protein